jgi:predicted O-linked N-acetylglucosamine transferase (SPINDLY family)
MTFSIRHALDAAWQHYRRGEWQQAEELYLQVLAMDPDQVDALHLLAAIAGQTGRDDQAIDYLHAVLRLRPELAAAHNNLGNVLARQGKQVEAVASFQDAVGLQPESAIVHNNLGNALREVGRLDEAVAHLQRALCIKSDYAEAHQNLGLALKEQGKLEQAVACLEESIRLNPAFAEAYLNLGNVLVQQGNLAGAVGSFREALRIRPDFVDALKNLCQVMWDLERFADAEASLRRVLAIRPNDAETHYKLGIVLFRQQKFDEAVESYREALRYQPDHAEAHLNLGSALKDQGRIDDAIAAYRAALRIKPDATQVHSNVILTLNYHPCSEPQTILEECLLWSRQHIQPLNIVLQPHGNRPDPERRLRIGYVSPEFRDQVDSFFITPLFSNHDHRQFEIFCYADVSNPDAVTGRLRGYADAWRSTVGLTNQNLADLVRSDQIDVLVDLKVHTANNRLRMFARKPAPVQVSWLGYPGTTGLSAIDYRLTDPYLDPPGLFDSFCSETSHRLPETFWCYDPLTDQPAVNTLPAIESGVITFGCLNNFAKVNDGCLQVWASILRAVPRSRFMLLAPQGQAREHVLSTLHREGISPSRVVFAAKLPRQAYLKLYHQIDLALDPLPYNGHTTSLDALWMGVPTPTLIGKTVVGRAGLSQLSNLGLQELAAETPEQYAAVVAGLAVDLPRLQELRSTLRPRMQRSPLMDGKRFAQNVEEAYRQMWRRWCQGRRLQ